MEEHKDKFKWRPGVSVLDLGCGVGDVTCDVIKREHMPDDYNRLVGK